MPSSPSRIDGVAGRRHAPSRWSRARCWPRARSGPAPARWCAASAPTTSASSTVVASNIRQGDWTASTAGEGVAIGARLADKLGLAVGDTITLVSPDGDVTPFGATPRVKAYPVVGDLRDRHVGVRCLDRLHAARGGAALFQRRRAARSRSRCSSTIPTRSTRCAPLIEAAAAAADLHHRLAAAQRDLLLGAAGRAQRHVHDPDADRPGRGAQHHLRPDHAGEGQGPRHRHPAHHGRDARRDHAHLPHDRRGDRRRPARSPASCSASSSASTSRRIRQFFSWLSGTMLFTPELYFLQPAAGRDGRQRDRLGRADGAGAVLPRDALSRPGGRRGSIRSRRCATNDGRPTSSNSKSVERHYVQGAARADHPRTAPISR